MHEFLKMLANIQSAFSLESYLRGAGYTIALILLWWTWSIDTTAARLFSTLLLATSIYFLTVETLKSPAGYGKYLLMRAAFLAFSIGRLALRVILMAIAATLSLIYFLIPIDIIPDIIIGIGWIEDLLLAIGLVSSAASAELKVPEPEAENNYLSLSPIYRHGIPCTIALLGSVGIRNMF